MSLLKTLASGRMRRRQPLGIDSLHSMNGTTIMYSHANAGRRKCPQRHPETEEGALVTKAV